MITLYTAIGTCKIKERKFPDVMAGGKEYGLGAQEFLIWSILAFRILTYQELRDEFYEKERELHILGEAEFARTETLLEDGDLIAMVSDGVTAGGCEWVGNLLESWPGGDPGDLAKKLVKTAREQRTDGHDDDITAVVMVLEGRPGVTPRRSSGQDREGTNC